MSQQTIGDRCLQANSDQSCQPSVLLEFALTLLRTPGRWATGRLAVNSDGIEVRPTDPAATRWDSTGALLLACSVHSPENAEPFVTALDCLWQAVDAGDKYANLFRWEYDPQRTHEDVLWALRRAIVLACAQERKEQQRGAA